MGRIFTWEDVGQKKVPTEEAFKKAAEQVREGLEDKEGIVGALFFGSFASGTHNRRSDIDCLVMFDPSSRRRSLRTLTDITASARSSNVLLEFVPISSNYAERGVHSISRLMESHLRVCAERPDTLIGVNPLDFMKSLDRTLVADALDYFAHKLDALEKYVIGLRGLSSSELMKAYRKVVEAPVHIARKVIQLNPHTTKDKRGEDRSILVGRYRVCGVSETMWRILEDVIAVDERYSQVLDSQLAGNSNRHEYDVALTEIERALPKVVEFVSGNIDFVLQSNARI